MGINGLGSALVMLKIPYNSPEAVSFTKELCEIKENLTWQASALLAKEKGVFPIYNKEKFENTDFFKSDRLNKETKELISKYGVRNGKTTTNPPLGNSSIFCDNVSNGIEPLYKADFERKVTCNWPEGLNKDNIKEIFNICKEKDYTCWKGEYQGKTYYYEPHNRGLCEITILRDYGYSWVLEKFPNEDHSKYLITTKNLDVDDHINIQEVVQYYCNQSVSKTANLPASYPFKKFKDLYIKAWKKGLNGFTTYRDGSMESVLSDIDTASKTKEIIKRDIKLPEQFLNGPCKIIKREGKKFYLHFSYLPEDNKMTFPVCMWIISNAKYSEKGDMVNCNKAARELAKLALKCGINEKIVMDGL
jgi:ribonucleoside-diphosphate reductase alpha chain